MEDDVITHLIRIPERETTRLGSKTIDGTPVIGFRHAYEMNGGDVQKDFWVDPETKLPVQIEERVFENDSDTPKIYSLYSNFRYNESLDDSLFSTDLPEGFEIDEVKNVFFSGESDSDSEKSKRHDRESSSKN